MSALPALPALTALPALPAAPHSVAAARALALVLALTASAGAARGQPQEILLPNAAVATSRGNSSTIFPWQSSPSHERHQWVYDASLFGVSGPIVIHEISIRADQSNVGLAAFCFPSVEVVLASASGPLASLTTTDLDGNLGPDRRLVRDGVPFAGGPVPPPAQPPFVSPWVRLGLDRRFVYDPTAGLPLVIDVRVCGKTLRWSQGMDGVSASSTTGRTLASASSCQANSGSSLSFLPVLRLEYAGNVASWQTNSAAAHLDIDQVAGDAFSPARIRRPAGTAFDLNWRSNLAGHVYGLVLVPSPVVGARTGGSTTAGGQFINLALGGSPPLVLLGTFVAPNGLANTLSFNIPTPLPPTSLQMFVVDPNHPDGFVLSAAVEIALVPGC